MEAIILAGGFGTRLEHLLEDIPKPMAPINNIPFLEILLDNLKIQKFTTIVLAVGYKYEVIKKYFGNTYKSMNLHYSIEDTPLLTGGAVVKALPWCNKENIFIINGDTFIDVNYNNMLKHHKNFNNDVTICSKLLYNFERYGSLKIKDNKIMSFDEKKFCYEGYINAGVYCIKNSLFDNYNSKIFSLETDFFQTQIQKKQIGSYISEGYFIDIGIPEDYYKANNELLGEI